MTLRPLSQSVMVGGAADCFFWNIPAVTLFSLRLRRPKQGLALK
jgi:hypothetical protein